MEKIASNTIIDSDFRDMFDAFSANVRRNENAQEDFANDILYDLLGQLKGTNEEAQAELEKFMHILSQ